MRAQAPGAEALLEKINNHIQRLEVLRHAMEELLDQGDFHWQEDGSEVWQRVFGALRRLLDQGGLPHLTPEAGDQERRQFHQAMEQRRRDILQTLETEPAQVAGYRLDFTSVLAAIDRSEEELLEKYPAMLERYGRFAALDARLFPLQLVAGFEERDIIRTVRISPLDAQQGFSARPLETKLSGDTFHHFGGFFKRSWRSNDILWGRLDGVCELVECLLDREDLRQLLGDADKRAQIRARLFPAEANELSRVLDVDAVFPKLPAARRAGLRRNLELLLSEDEDAFEQALEHFKEFQSGFIEAAQLEILYEQLPCVLADGVRDMMDWNRYAVPEHRRQKLPQVKYDPRQAMFLAVEGAIDPLVATVAAEAAARQAISEVDQTPPDRLAGFFRDHYRVGSESLGDIPRIVLLNIISAALLVVRNAFITGLGSRGRAIAGLASFRLFVDWPLRLFHQYLTWSRESPQTAGRWRVPLVVLAVVVLALSLLTGGALLASQRGLILWRAIAFVVVPILWLMSNLVYYMTWRRPAERPSRLWTTAKVLLETAVVSAPVLALLFCYHFRGELGRLFTAHRLPPWSGWVLLLACFGGAYWAMRLSRPRRVSDRELRSELKKLRPLDLVTLARWLKIDLAGPLDLAYANDPKTLAGAVLASFPGLFHEAGSAEIQDWLARRAGPQDWEKLAGPAHQALEPLARELRSRLDPAVRPGIARQQYRDQLYNLLLNVQTSGSTERSY